MAKFRVKYFGSNDVPVQLIKPILDEINAEMIIANPRSEAEVAEAGRDADGIIMHGSVPFTREIIAQLKRTKVVCRTGVGVDRMDLQAAEEFGIKVCNAAGCNSIEVSEQAIGLLIAVSRKLVRMNQYVREGRWRRHTAELHAYRGPVSRIAGKTLGIVGLGHVGKQVAPRAQGLKLNVQAVDPYLDPKIAHEMNVKLVSFEELVRTSDFISVHAPLTGQTRRPRRPRRHRGLLRRAGRGKNRRRGARRHRPRAVAGGSQDSLAAERDRYLPYRREFQRVLRRLPDARRARGSAGRKRETADDRSQKPLAPGRSR